MEIYDFLVCGKKDPVGIDEAEPVFSWKLRSEERGTNQERYILRISSGGKVIWEQDRKSGETLRVRYRGESLRAFTEYKAELKVRDNHGKTAESCVTFETGKLDEEFSAQFIRCEREDIPVYALRKQIRIGKEVVKARLYATAHGLYEFYINGEKVGKDFLAPFWTNYKRTIEYQTYDVTAQVRSGANDLEMLIGKGWYAGALGFAGEKAHYGAKTAGFAQLSLTYADGTSETVVTDGTWRSGRCFIADSELYYGEKQTGEVSGEEFGVCLEENEAQLVGQINEPVRVVEEVAAKSSFETPKGEYVIDFGQNLVGYVRIRVCGKKGEVMRVGHAEVLDKEGNFYTQNLRSAVSVDEYELTGEEQVLRPHFTSHGFRYIKVEGARPSAEDCMALVLHSDMRRTGQFTCSDAKLMQLQSNIVWGQRGNFVDVPTDCPQRDERLGWTGDANVFYRTAAFNYNVSLFFRKWLEDLKSEQSLDGNVPHVIPNVLGEQEGAALWSDCAAMIPWNQYLVYGNIYDLREQFFSMKKWVDYVASKCGANGLWQTGFQYGDWLALDGGNEESRTGASDKYFIANIFYYVSLCCVVNAARELEEMDVYDEYMLRRDKVLKEMRREYFTATGRMVSETQTACTLALYFGIVPKKYREKTLETLRNNLAENKNHLNTGFAGTPFLLFALSDGGAHDVAARVLFQEDYPSWLYAVNRGATTVWERWNGILPDGELYDPAMNSFNHYSYGSVGDFLYRRVAGLECAAPGYKKIVIQPRLTEGIEWARAEYESVYGKIVSGYDCRDGVLKIYATVPCNATATVCIPGTDKKYEVGSGEYVFESKTDVVLKRKRFTQDSTLAALVNAKHGKEIIEELSPGMLDGPMIAFAMQMTVAEISAFSGEDGKKLFSKILERLNEEE